VTARTGPAGGEALAVDIRRIRERLDPDRLNNPQVRAELQELYQHVTTGLDQCRGRHRLSASGATKTPPADVSAPVVPRSVRSVSQAGLKPNPLTARTAAELVGSMREYREWSGETSLRKLAAQARQKVSSSTMCTALNSDNLPTLKVVVAIIEECGGSLDDQQAFAMAWRRIKEDAWSADGAPALWLVPRTADAGN
jgi:hypothetical protein